MAGSHTDTSAVDLATINQTIANMDGATATSSAEEGGKSPSGAPAIAKKKGDRAGEGKVPLNEYERTCAYLEAQKGKPKAAGFRAGEGKEPANEYERACSYLEKLEAHGVMPTPLSPERTSCDVPNEYEKAVAYLEAKKATGQITPERIGNMRDHDDDLRSNFLEYDISLDGAQKLRNAGVCRLSDFYYIQSSDVRNMNMSLLDQRKTEKMLESWHAMQSGGAGDTFLPT